MSNTVFLQLERVWVREKENERKGGGRGENERIVFAVTHLLKILRRDDGLCRHFTATIYLVRNVLVLVHFKTKQKLSDRQGWSRIAIRKNTNCVLQLLCFAVVARISGTYTHTESTNHKSTSLSLPLSLICTYMHTHLSEPWEWHIRGVGSGRFLSEVDSGRFLFEIWNRYFLLIMG